MTDSLDNFHDQCVDSLVAAGGVGLALALEHVGLWPIIRHIDPANELSPLFPYTVGTATIGVGLTALALKWKLPIVAVAFWLLAGSGGVVVGGLRLYRKWLRLETDMHINSGYGAGQVAGVRRYTSEYQKRPGVDRVA